MHDPSGHHPPLFTDELCRARLRHQRPDLADEQIEGLCHQAGPPAAARPPVGLTTIAHPRPLIALDFAVCFVAFMAGLVIQRSEGSVAMFGAGPLAPEVIIPTTVDHEGERGCLPMIRLTRLFDSP